METESILSNVSSETEVDALPLPFFNLGPVEWSCHGLQGRTANSLKHGSERYWVIYCPTKGIKLQDTIALET